MLLNPFFGFVGDAPPVEGVLPSNGSIEGDPFQEILQSVQQAQTGEQSSGSGYPSLAQVIADAIAADAPQKSKGSVHHPGLERQPSGHPRLGQSTSVQPEPEVPIEPGLTNGVTRVSSHPQILPDPSGSPLDLGNEADPAIHTPTTQTEIPFKEGTTASPRDHERPTQFVELHPQFADNAHPQTHAQPDPAFAESRGFAESERPSESEGRFAESGRFVESEGGFTEFEGFAESQESADSNGGFTKSTGFNEPEGLAKSARLAESDPSPHPSVGRGEIERNDSETIASQRGRDTDRQTATHSRSTSVVGNPSVRQTPNTDWQQAVTDPQAPSETSKGSREVVDSPPLPTGERVGVPIGRVSGPVQSSESDDRPASVPTRSDTPPTGYRVTSPSGESTSLPVSDTPEPEPRTVRLAEHPRPSSMPHARGDSATHNERVDTVSRESEAPRLTDSREAAPRTPANPVEQIGNRRTEMARAALTDLPVREDIQVVHSQESVSMTQRRDPVSYQTVQTDQMMEAEPQLQDLLPTGRPEAQIVSNTSTPEPGFTPIGVVRGSHEAITSAPVSDAPAQVPTDVEETKVTHQIVRGARFLTREGANQVTLRLDPPELGEVTIRLSSTSKALSGEIRVESRMVQEIVNRNMADLRESLSSQGIQVDNIEVTVDSGNRSTTDRDGNAAFRREQAERENQTSSDRDRRPQEREDQQDRRPRQPLGDGQVDYTA